MIATRRMLVLLTLSVLASLMLSACGAGEAEATPTLSVEQIQTAAVATFAAGLTQTAFAMPTETPTPTATSTQFPTNTPGAPGGLSPTASCYGLVYIRDVTIPDNTPMTPGQAFDKTWLVQNTGSCPWEPGFTFNVISGDSMGATALTLNQAVNPGMQYEITVPMIAPTGKTGTIEGWWRMADKNGVYFGNSLSVVIVIGGAATSTGTPVPPTATATETPTP